MVSNNFKLIIKYIFIFGITIGLLWLGLCVFLGEEHKKILYSVSLKNHIIAGFFLIITFLVSGLQLRYVYKESAQIKLKIYDTLTIPYVINLWGFIIPVQGSFLYLMSYFKSKYKIGFTSSTIIYGFMFLVSLTFFGFIGLFIIWNSVYFSLPVVFLLLNFLLIPFYLVLFNYFFKRFNFKNQFFKKIESLLLNSTMLFKEYKIILILLLFNTIIILLNTSWCYWICKTNSFNIPFSILLLISVIMQLTLLIKLTPGNLGLAQLSNGGVFALFGFDPSIGVFVSLFQLVTLLIFSVPLGIVFSIYNSKYFSIKKLFSKNA